jgi:hypothetical protein
MNLFRKNKFKFIEKRVPKGYKYKGFLFLTMIFEKLTNYGLKFYSDMEW